MNAIYQENFTIPSYLINPERQLTMSALLQIFQEMGYNHVKVGGFDDETMQEMGLFWVLNRLRLNVIRYPKWHDEVVLQTWMSRLASPFYVRNFRLLDSEGNELANACSLWILLDTTNRKPVKKFDEKGFPYLPDEHADCGLPEKIRIANPIWNETKNFYTIKHSDLDIAGHCNNAKYLTIVLDALNKNIKYKYLEINYNQESMLGDTLEIADAVIGNESFFKIEKEGKNICTGKFF
jgi:medium-chain acyl-[acyl-carrier-protein] hydrolase